MKSRINPFLEFATKDENFMRCSDPVSSRYNYNHISQSKRQKPFFSAHKVFKSAPRNGPFLAFCRRVQQARHLVWASPTRWSKVQDKNIKPSF
jgi:hypothetical protein